MIKARNKKLSMLLVLAMLMTMFVGIGTASAASVEWEADNMPTYTKSSTATQSTSADVILSLDDTAMVNPYVDHMVTFTLPDGVEFVLPAQATGDKYESAVYFNQISGDGTFTCDAYIKSNKAVDIYVTREAAGDGVFLLSFEDLLVKSGSGDLTVTMIAPSGSKFSSGSLAIAKISGTGSVTAKAGTKATFGDQGGYIDGMTIAELGANVLEQYDEITFKLPKGFTWDDPTPAWNGVNMIIGGGWGFDGEYNFMGDYSYEIDGRELVVTILHECDAEKAGRITVGSDLPFGGNGTGFAWINVDEDTAKFGDITVAVTSTNDNGPDIDIVVATYGDYGIEVIEDTTEKVVSGRTDQELGEFFIEEGIAGSIMPNRSITLELPKGVKWVTLPTVEAEEGDLMIGSGTAAWSIVPDTSSRKIKALTNDYFTEEAAKLLFKDMEVKIEPGFEGPIDITVGGKSGAQGTVTVAECTKAITVKAENPTKVEIGAMNQAAGDILIIENVEEAILDGTYNQIEITLPRGVNFASEPTVEVEAGDLEIDDVDLADSAFNRDGALLITIENVSTEASTIRISDIFLTVDRTVPEGNVLAKFEGSKALYDASVALNFDTDFSEEDFDSYEDYQEALLEAFADYLADRNEASSSDEDSLGSTAFVDWATDKSVGSVEIATTITPKTGGYAQFVIGSNIYSIGGTPYVMDVVPYIKDSR
ncbi:MAG: hypothetical protein GXY34_10230, partial [Syntrophomonadaceae bacterium]|nr:hypothetical protein [Syntrophomonadaceae bacterium]